jgi:hypothetical protein
VGATARPPAGQAAATTAITSTTLAPTTSAAAPASSTTGTSLRFRGMTLTIPNRWKVDTSADGATVANGQACFRSDLLDRDVCPGFEVYGPDGIAHGYEDRPYRLDEPYHPGTDVSPCATAPDDALEGDHSLAKGGFAKVGAKTPPTIGPGGSPAFPPTAPSPPASHMSSGSGTCPSPRS